MEKYPEERHCRGCKLGYEVGARDLSKAKCRMKVCCFVEKKLETCADCTSYPCEVLQVFWTKNATSTDNTRNNLNS
jgi:transposase-like protein